MYSKNTEMEKWADSKVENNINSYKMEFWVFCFSVGVFLECDL